MHYNLVHYALQPLTRYNLVIASRVRDPGRNGRAVIWPSNRALQRPGIVAAHDGHVPSGVIRLSRM